MEAIIGMVKGRRRHTFRCSFFSTTKVQSALVLATRGSVLLYGRTQCMSMCMCMRMCMRMCTRARTCAYACARTWYLPHSKRMGVARYAAHPCVHSRPPTRPLGVLWLRMGLATLGACEKAGSSRTASSTHWSVTCGRQRVDSACGRGLPRRASAPGALQALS